MKKSQKGFTLMEVMLAIVVFSIGVFAVGTMQMRSVAANKYARELTEATALAQRQIEEMMFWDYDDVRLTDGDGVDTGTAGLENNPDEPDPAKQKEPDERHPKNPIRQGGVAQTYNLYWNVAEDYPITNTKTISVIVTWAGEGVRRSVSVEYNKARII
ncbi:MAG: prepilin-type N-terminal cleavage/methylation domain-containing protein [Thermodesulfobacteriota bacterium]|nr:prepilin-type N-terminal cleavage/methylation domain-containing protein [Thermodesulfobacteriota bacterium]